MKTIKLITIAILLLLLPTVVHAVNLGDIVILAGRGAGDNGPAISACLNKPPGVAVDSSGNIYIADFNLNRIRKVASGTGIITTVAGNGAYGFSGDNGPATSARLSCPCGVTVDSSGNLYIVDQYSHRIRKVSSGTGIITTVAGNGAYGFSGDNGPATSASLFYPSCVTVDSSGNLYIADASNNRIRKVDSGTGIITTVAGNGIAGFSGDDGAATAANLNLPTCVTVDSSGNLYIADINNNRIRKVAKGTGIITTVAGNGTQGFSGDNGAATSASLYRPSGVTVDSSGNLYIADAMNNRIRKVASETGIITTVAGNGIEGFSGDNGAATSASLYRPPGVTVDSSGNLYVVDYFNNRIRKVASGTGIITTVAGNGTQAYAGDNLPAASAKFYELSGVTVDSSGNLYIADNGNHRIRKLASGTGIITTVAGNGTGAYAGDNGPATSASLYYPAGVTVDSSGNLFIADTTNHRIRKVDSGTGIITTVAGNGTGAYAGDNGPATSASLYWPYAVTIDSSGNLYIADYGNHRIRKVASGTGIITTVAGNGTGAYAGDNGPATAASLYRPDEVIVDSSGNLYIADNGNHRIRKVDNGTGIITTMAGNGTGAYAGDNGPATSASLYYPCGIALDSSGNLYIADDWNNRIRKVASGTGIITTVAGNGNYDGFIGDNGPATSASISWPNDVAIDNIGNLYITDLGDVIRKVYLNPVPTVTALVSSAVSSVSGSAVTFTATVTSAEGIPINTTVTFMDGASTIGSGLLDATGTATVTTSSLAPGCHSITAVYPASGVLAASTSPSLVQTVIASPTATTLPVSTLSITAATLNGTINDNGAITTVSFEYGLTIGYGNSASGGTVTAGSGATAVSAAISGLSGNTTYHFRVVGQNSEGTSYGNDATFFTGTSAGQTIGPIGFSPILLAVGGTTTASATATSGLTVRFSSTTLTVCTVSGTTVTGVAAGPCTVAADQDGNANYSAAPQVTQNITVGQGSQNITFGAAPAVVVGGTGTVSATGGASGNAVTFASTTQSICTVSGTTVIGVAAGICTIAANQAGNANYAAAPQVTQNITIENTADPIINISTLTDDAVTANPVLNLAGTIIDVAGIKALTVNNRPVTLNADGSYSYAVTLVAGSNANTITAVDNNGNQASVSRSITYDATAPQLTVTEPADGALTVANTATVNGTIGAGVTSVNVKINGVLQAAVISGSNYSTVVNLATGMNTIEVIAADNAALHTNSIKRTVYFDVTKPGMAITFPVEDILVTGNNVDISGVVDPAPLDATLRVSTDGATFTPPATVTGTGTTHITFNHSVTFPLEGYYPVTVQVRDSADNLLGATQRNVIYSRGTIFINKGDPFTITTAVTLDLDYTGAVSMQFSTNGTTWTAWERFKTPRSFTLPAGDGVKTVYVRFKEKTGQLSDSFSDTIILDTKPPSGTITINDGAYATTEPNVTLSLSVAEVNGVVEMQFSDNNKWTDVKWETFAPTRAYTIPAVPGVRTVYARFRDSAGKVSAVCSDTIVYTMSPLPTATAGAVTINGGAEFTTTTAAKLTITTPSHDPAFTRMRFSTNGTTWTAWETVKPAKSLTLPAGDGVKTVYVKFRDSGVTESEAYMDTIILDTRLPVGTISINGGAPTTTDQHVTLSLSAADANGVTDMQFSTSNNWTGVLWEQFAPIKSFDLGTSIPGKKSVYVRFRDAAGKISAACSATIQLVAP